MRRNMRGVLACDAAPHGLRNGVEARVGSVTLPAVRRQRLNLAEAERRFHRFETDRQIGTAFSRSRGLIAHEVSVVTDRALGPRNDHAFRYVEMILDVFAPVSPAAE